MSIRFHYLTPFAFILIAACAENDLGVGIVDAAADLPGSMGGAGGTPVGGAGGTSLVGTGGVFLPGTGGALPSTGGADGGATGPCGAATCLTALFQTCVPQGSCVYQGGGSPSAVFGDTCYANGVIVSQVGQYSGTGTGTTSTLAVHRDGSVCYVIKARSSAVSSALSYAIADGNDQVIASAVTADKEGHVTVTCQGGAPVTVSSSCLEPVASNSSCTQGACPSSGVDGGALDAGGGCDPFTAAPKPITLGTVLGVGKSASGTIYVVDQDSSTYRVFVSDASGTLVRQHASGSGISTDATGAQYVFSAGDAAAPFVLQVEVPKTGATRMGVMPGTLTDRKSIVIGQDGEELAVLPGSAIASMPLRNLSGVTTEYIATLPDGQLMLVTRPTDDWTYADFRVFVGPLGAVAERAVTNVTRARDGGTTTIIFDLDGVQATAYFPVVLVDGGIFTPGPATLTVSGTTSPLNRLSAPPAATYRCL